MSWRGVTGVKEGLGAESAGIFLSLFKGGLGDKAGTGDEAGSGVGDRARGGVGDGVSGADAGANTGGRSWIGVGERMLARRTASTRIHDTDQPNTLIKLTTKCTSPSKDTVPSNSFGITCTCFGV